MEKSILGGTARLGGLASSHLGLSILQNADEGLEISDLLNGMLLFAWRDHLIISGYHLLVPSLVPYVPLSRQE